MKKFIITSIFILPFVCGLKAQITLPTFAGTDVVVMLTIGQKDVIKVSDGITKSYEYRMTSNDYPFGLALTFSELRKQGYKLITSNGAVSVIGLADIMAGTSFYVFQKE